MIKHIFQQVNAAYVDIKLCEQEECRGVHDALD